MRLLAAAADPDTWSRRASNKGAALAMCTIVTLVMAPGIAAAQTEIRRYEAGVAPLLEDSERGGPVSVTVLALLQDGIPWVLIEAESGASASVSLSVPVSDIRDFLEADPGAFLSKTVTVPMDEDRTEVFVPAFAWVWGDYFGLVRKDWWDATTYAFMFRAGEGDTIVAECDVATASSLIALLSSAEQRIVTWETGG